MHLEHQLPNSKTLLRFDEWKVNHNLEGSGTDWGILLHNRIRCFQNWNIQDKGLSEHSVLSLAIIRPKKGLPTTAIGCVDRLNGTPQHGWFIMESLKIPPKKWMVWGLHFRKLTMSSSLASFWLPSSNLHGFMARRLILIVQRRSGLAQPRKRRDLKWWWSNGWVQVSPGPKNDKRNGWILSIIWHHIFSCFPSWLGSKILRVQPRKGGFLGIILQDGKKRIFGTLQSGGYSMCRYKTTGLKKNWTSLDVPWCSQSPQDGRSCKLRSYRWPTSHHFPLQI